MHTGIYAQRDTCPPDQNMKTTSLKINDSMAHQIFVNKFLSSKNCAINLPACFAVAWERINTIMYHPVVTTR